MQDALDRIYNRIRAEEQAALARRIDDAYKKAPRLAELDAARTQLLSDAGAKRRTAKESILALAAISEEEQDILADCGLPSDTLTLHYRCETCRDTGYVGSAPKRPCACRLLYREQASPEAGINDRETFPAFLETVYPDETQKKRAVNAKKLCEAYAAALPRPEKPNMLITGMPGLGKSYLVNAVCYAAISRGIDAKRVTAYRFVQDMLSDIREHAGNAARYCIYPVLAIDDLGSEPDIPNVSTEWLFAVVNERALSGRATIFATNLSLSELQARYGERVMSRLCDRNTTTALRLTGANLRTL